MPDQTREAILAKIADLQMQLDAMTRTKPSINWEHVSPQYGWMAKDQNDDVYLYRDKPERIHNRFFNSEPSYCLAKCFASHMPGTCNWRDSLTCRPGADSSRCIGRNTNETA